ncbi:MAG: alpha-galactosidase [Silvibacterium sp.]
MAALGATTLHSADTIITLDAGKESPRVTQLSMKAGAPWKGETGEPLIDHVEIGGHEQPLHWKFNETASASGSTWARFVYDSGTPRLRLFWEWRVRAAHGPIEHSIRIQNLSGESLWIPLQNSLQVNWRVPASEHLGQLWVEKGAGGPSADGTHRIPINNDYNWTGTSSTYAHPAAGQQREMIPYVLVDRPDADGSGWYIGIEFSGRTRITLERNGDSLEEVAGLNPEPGPFKTYLGPGESFDAPTVFVGAFRGGPDEAGNILRRWVRDVLNNPVTVRDPEYPLVVNNSWGSGMAIDAEQARSMIRDSAELGFEMFHLDAGWFRGVGDWVPDPKKFPDGLAPIAEYAHSFGLRFGLWMDWAQAGLDSHSGSLYVRDPNIRDWLTTYPPADWKPEDAFKGVTIDIGVPVVHDWAAAEVNRVVRDYHLDMLEHDGYVVAQGCDRTDHPHAPPDPEAIRRFEDSGFLWVESSNSTDVSYHATRSYYDIYTRLRRQHPRLLLEICNDGGRMVDFGSAAHGDYFSISDAYDPVSNRRAFYDSSYVLPPAMLESYVEKWPAPRVENFLYVLRSGMMGWFTLMLDTTDWTPEQHATAKEAIAVYKSRLRPLIREADLYHVSPRPDGVHWDGIEYLDAPKQSGVLFAFHGSSKTEPQYSFVLRGLQQDARYQLTFQDKSSPDHVAYGKDLMRGGVQVTLPIPDSSELVFINKISE